MRISDWSSDVCSSDLFRSLKSATILNVITRRQLKLSVQLLTDLFHQAFHVASAHVNSHIRSPIRIVTGNLHGTRFILNLGYRGKRYLITFGEIHIQVLQVVYALPVLLIQPHHQIKTAFSFKDHSGMSSGKSRTDYPVQILNSKAVLRYFREIGRANVRN